MARTRKIIPVATPVSTKFSKTDSWTNPDGFVLKRGDEIKIKGKNSFGVGEWGIRFRIDSFCTNLETGKQWVDCYELYRGQAGGLRSFPLDRIKRIPQRRRKRVNRKQDS